MITSAAVKITLLNGEEKIIPCHRHGDAYYICRLFNIERDRTKDVDGFIKTIPDKDDPFNIESEVFVNRVDGFVHALECDQITQEKLEEFGVGKLYSEHLW